MRVAKILLVLIRLYQATLSKVLRGSCRFHPSCSHYAYAAIEQHGAWRGSALMIGRLLRCHPFSAGGFDPPPQKRGRHRTTRGAVLPDLGRECAGTAQGQLPTSRLLGAVVLGLMLLTSGALAQDAPSASGPREVVLHTPHLEVTFAAHGGGASHIRLMKEQFQRDEANVDLTSTDKAAYLPLSLTSKAAGLDADATWRLEQLSPEAVKLTWEGKGIRVERTVRGGASPYLLRSSVTVSNTSGSNKRLNLVQHAYHYVAREDEEGGFLAARSPAVSHGLCLQADEMERLDRDDLERPYASKDAKYAAIENTYFVMALITPDAGKARCKLEVSHRGGTAEEPHGSLFIGSLVHEPFEVPAHSSNKLSTLYYAGPKKPAALRGAGHQLKEVVDLGIFAVIAGTLVDLLAFIYSGVGNWGLAIILLTLLVKLVLYPLTERSFKSMARMRRLKPEMDRINELYADSREKKGAAMMELYRRHKINPMGGCLPQLLQLPIWWALYTSLSTNIELYNAPFVLFWNDLSAPDPFLVLPIMLGGLMVVQQKLTPTSMDPAQAKVMMYVMPAFLTFIMHFLPAGLCLYMVTNSALGIAQQKFIEHRLEVTEGKKAEADQADPPGDMVKAEEKPAPGKSGAAVRRRTRRGRA